MNDTIQNLFDLSVFQQTHVSVKTLRQHMSWVKKSLYEHFTNNVSVTELITQYTTHIDELITYLWLQCGFDRHPEISLIAVGGYGRCELHPCSDLDFLILVPQIKESIKAPIEQFIQILWDIGLEVGHSVRTIQDCAVLAKSDIGVITTLMDARLLIGDQQQYYALLAALHPNQMWSSREFFQAKQEEQRQRYEKYSNTSYNLEPNIKNGPGGLRDSQTIAWVARRHFNTHSWSELVDCGFLQAEDYELLKSAQHFLWKVRFALHMLTGRKEDRLLFEHQKQLATLFHYTDDAHKLGIEIFMRDYYRAVNTLRELNDLLLQYFRESILSKAEEKVTEINDRFRVRDQYIEVTDDILFAEKPEAILEIFILLASHPEIRGVRASTIRLLRQYRHLIDDNYRGNTAHQQLFIQLLSQSSNMSPQLQRMSRYGLLEKYIPEFAAISGQMQYDLYHAYTVDQHTIFVVRNIRRFRDPEFRGQFPLCAEILETISKIELLHIAALFHDIGKGSGGNHSQIGAEFAVNFCARHQLAEKDSELVVWLVRHHLLMSVTAQRKDIYDPETILQFAKRVGDQEHLDHLYVLTVADILATNPTLWNNWKDSLLKELYHSTKHLLTQQNKIISQDTVIQNKKLRTLELLNTTQFAESAVNALWAQFRNSYFYRETPQNIAWHTQTILNTSDHSKPLVRFHQQRSFGPTEFFSYHPFHPAAFLITTVILSNFQVNILEARIFKTVDNFSLSSYLIFDQHNQPIESEEFLSSLQHTLEVSLSSGASIPRLISRQIPRQLQHFKSKTLIKFRQDTQRLCTVMTLSTSDRPGLLALVAKALHESQVVILIAKIATLGEKVDDVFFILNQELDPIFDETHLTMIETKILGYLDNN